MALYDQIQELIRQLDHLGYQPFQIHQIIEEAVGTIQWESISPAAQQELIKGLENHIFFAVRCRKINY